MARNSGTTPQTKPAAETIRPKAFRRPPLWVAPPSPPTKPSTSAKPAMQLLVPQPQQPKPEPVPSAAPHDTLYSLFLLALVIGINIIAAFLLSAWQPHIKPHYAGPETVSISPVIEDEKNIPVTLFSSPLENRRTLRISPIDVPIDSTDAIDMPAANPSDDQ